MSIVRDEAERLYPIHRAGDDRAGFIQPAIDVLSQNAYAKGRTAEPCEEQVEAGAIALFEKQTNFSKGVNHTEDDVRDAWIHMPEINQMRFRELARAVLDAARKAVM